MDYTERLRQKAKETGSIVCLGLDPELSKIPLKGTPKQVITKFYLDILAEIVKTKTYPGCAKPNAAFYEQYGIEGLEALKEVIDAYKKAGMLIILDAKRGDIGKTSSAYAKAAFEFWGADAITVAPYMGSDSVQPFMEYSDKGKGIYILNRTSNKGAVDFQNLDSNGKVLYMRVAQKITEWHKPGTGAVTGATYPAELEEISSFYVKSGKKVPLLIPGVGAQGGSAKEVVDALKRSGNELAIHRINSSSGINYAYEKYKTTDYAAAAVRALKELNEEIGKID